MTDKFVVASEKNPPVPFTLCIVKHFQVNVFMCKIHTSHQSVKEGQVDSSSSMKDHWFLGAAQNRMFLILETRTQTDDV